MWKNSEKNLMLGVGYAIWGSVSTVTFLGVALTLIACVYFVTSIYQSFKED